MPGRVPGAEGTDAHSKADTWRAGGRPHGVGWQGPSRCGPRTSPASTNRASPPEPGALCCPGHRSSASVKQAPGLARPLSGPGRLSRGSQTQEPEGPCGRSGEATREPLLQAARAVQAFGRGTFCRGRLRAGPPDPGLGKWFLWEGDKLRAGRVWKEGQRGPHTPQVQPRSQDTVKPLTACMAGRWGASWGVARIRLGGCSVCCP